MPKTRFPTGAAAVSLAMFQWAGLSGFEGSYTPERLQAKLQETARMLNDCHLIVATRHAQPFGKPRTSDDDGVIFYELWLSGDNAQIRAVNSRHTVEPWWTGNPFQPRHTPLTSADLVRVDGLIACLRGGPEDHYVWAEFRKFRPAQRAPTPGLYARSRSLRRTSYPFVPLIALRRRWQLPEDRGLWPVVNLLAETSLEQWRVVRRELRGNKDVVYAEVASQTAPHTFPLARHRGTLSLLPIWKVWFSTQEGLAPVRIEQSVRYQFDGQEFPLETACPLLVYEASEHFELRPGVWFPRTGKQEHYVRSPDAPPISFDPDRLVDDLLEHDKLVVHDTSYILTDRREWHVLSLRLIPPREDLWLEPPDGVAVYTLDTEEYYVQGKSEQESRRILGVLEDSQAPSPSGTSSPRHVWTVALVVINAVAICIIILRHLLTRARFL